MADKLDVTKAYEAIARILSEREHVNIKVTSIKKKEDSREETA